MKMQYKPLAFLLTKHTYIGIFVLIQISLKLNNQTMNTGMTKEIDQGSTIKIPLTFDQRIVLKEEKEISFHLEDKKMGGVDISIQVEPEEYFVGEEKKSGFIDFEEKEIDLVISEEEINDPLYKRSSGTLLYSSKEAPIYRFFALDLEQPAD